MERALVPVVSAYKDFKDMPLKERDQHWLPGTQTPQHAKLRRYERCFPIGDYFKFCFVRNPWDRAVSQMAFLRSAQQKIFVGGTFKENLWIYCNTNAKSMGHDLAACQVDYIKTHDGSVSMDFIGRFEKLNMDFAEVCRKLGVPQIPSLPHIFNMQRKVHYREFYDDESAGWIRDRFAADIEYFNYTF
jgi:hypothetical protein